VLAPIPFDPTPRHDDETEVLDDEDVEAVLRDVRAFLNDPTALLERAVDLLRRKKNEIASWLFFGALATQIVSFAPAIVDVS